MLLSIQILQSIKLIKHKPIHIDSIKCILKAQVIQSKIIPIIYFSVQWWNTLHQGASVSLTQAPSMAMIMLVGMLLMALASWMYTVTVSLMRVRCIILEREQHAGWLDELREVKQ